MLTFYRNSENTFTRWVEDKLNEMVVAHEVIEAETNTKLPDGIPREELPILSDGHKQWHSEDDIKAFLEQLHQDLQLSQSLQSDTCHLDPKNPDECL
jgi:hypothetical protein